MIVNVQQTETSCPEKAESRNSNFNPKKEEGTDKQTTTTITITTTTTTTTTTKQISKETIAFVSQVDSQ